MKVLIIHNRYYHVSGPETYLFNLKKELEIYGHQADVFTLNYSKNIKSVFSNYFPNPIGNRKYYSFKNQNLSLFEKIKVITSLFFRFDVYDKLNSLISNNHYDGVIILQFWGKLSPSIFKVLINRNIPAVLRISDFGLICGTNTLLRDNKHTEECINKNFGCIKNKCVDNSYSKSLVNKLAQLYFKKKYSKKIDFIFTCKNTQSIFHKAGFNKNTHVIPTFYPNKFVNKKSFKSKKILYLGRVDEDKGLDEIITLFPNSKEIILEIWGRGNSDYILKLKKIISNRKIKNINLRGQIAHSKVYKLFEDSIFSIIPSKWHDNLPNSLIESLSNGVPVISPNYGCFPEFIINEKNGLLYDNYNDLKKIFKKILNLKDSQKKEFSLNSTMFAKKTFSSKAHIDKLLNIFSST